MNKKSKAGFSLVEAMLSILLFLVLLIGGVAVNFHSGSGIVRQQLKREAIIQANQEMEEQWNRSYNDLLALAGSTKSKTLPVNGRQMPVTVQYGNSDTDDRGQRFIEIAVSIAYSDTAENVSLKSRRYALGLSRAGL